MFISCESAWTDQSSCLCLLIINPCPSHPTSPDHLSKYIFLFLPSLLTASISAVHVDFHTLTRTRMHKITIKVNLIPKPRLNFFFFKGSSPFLCTKSGEWTAEKEKKKKKKNETVIKSPDKRVAVLCRS